MELNVGTNVFTAKLPATVVQIRTKYIFAMHYGYFHQIASSVPSDKFAKLGYKTNIKLSLICVIWSVEYCFSVRSMLATWSWFNT